MTRHAYSGYSCLHQATRALRLNLNNFSSIVESTEFLVMLIEAGLRVTDQDVFGETPWEIARRLCHTRRKVFDDALTICGIDTFGLFVDGESCPLSIDKGRCSAYLCHCRGSADDDSKSDDKETVPVSSAGDFDILVEQGEVEEGYTNVRDFENTSFSISAGRRAAHSDMDQSFMQNDDYCGVNHLQNSNVQDPLPWHAVTSSEHDPGAFAWPSRGDITKQQTLLTRMVSEQEQADSSSNLRLPPMLKCDYTYSSAAAWASNS